MALELLVCMNLNYFILLTLCKIGKVWAYISYFNGPLTLLLNRKPTNISWWRLFKKIPCILHLFWLKELQYCSLSKVEVRKDCKFRHPIIGKWADSLLVWSSLKFDSLQFSPPGATRMSSTVSSLENLFAGSYSRA